MYSWRLHADDECQGAVEWLSHDSVKRGPSYTHYDTNQTIFKVTRMQLTLANAQGSEVCFKLGAKPQCKTLQQFCYRGVCTLAPMDKGEGGTMTCCTGLGHVHQQETGLPAQLGAVSFLQPVVSIHSPWLSRSTEGGGGGQRLKFLETAAVPKTIYDSFPLLSAFAYSFSEEKFGFFFSFD